MLHYHIKYKDMAKNQAPAPPPQSNSGMNIGRTMIALTIVSILGLLGFNYFKNFGFTTGGITGEGTYTHIPEEIQIKYVNADFEYELDDENTLAILSNPRRYRKEFNQMVYDFNVAMLEHVATRMNLPDSLMRQVENRYQEHHPYLKQLYYNDFITLKDTSSALYETWYNSESTTAVDVMKEVSSKYTCFLVNHVISSLVASQNGKIFGTGRNVDDPCLIATTEAMRPMMARLQDKAAVMDFSRSKGLMEEKVEKVIAELATMEVRDKKGINKQLQTKIWGYAVSSTDIEVSAISVLKVGFKLNKYFDLKVDPKRKRVVVTLPDPEILSHEVYPKVDKLDVGWMRELDNKDLNKNFNVLRREFRNDARNSDVFDKSKDQAVDLMTMMLEPLVKNIGRDYKMSVKFKDTEPDIPADFDMDDDGDREPIEAPDSKKKKLPL